ncbi:MAG: hypothetical protein QF691_00205 [SAR324 cluster bacterium]|jgi:hypothetical protein|nr:hypothetical protein [SAR324 cluster bacterium]|tara:strand:+ start:173 stop:472 length:300 start_codon:yes stop_codon:yes gene_type:complete
MSEERYPINIWVNEERYSSLESVGLSSMCEEMLAGMKVIRVFANDTQKDKILKVFPTAKFDASTTKSIELLPREIKDGIFSKVVEQKKLDVLDDFLSAY